MKKTAKIVSGLNIHSLSAEELAEAMDWRRELHPGLGHIKTVVVAKKLAPLASKIIRTGKIPGDLEGEISRITGISLVRGVKVVFACTDLEEDQWQIKVEHDVVTLYFGRNAQ